MQYIKVSATKVAIYAVAKKFSAGKKNFFYFLLHNPKKRRTFAPANDDRWCNGSTTDFGSVCLGSNPCRSTLFATAKKPLTIIVGGFFPF